MKEDRVTFLQFVRQEADLLFALADRVYAQSLDIEQPIDRELLAEARRFGWQPWHEREKASA